MRIQTDLLVKQYQKNMFAAAFAACKDPQDAEDAVQDAFLAYHTGNKEFESEEHIRHWLLRVAINKAKNTRLSFWKQHKVSLEEYMETCDFESPEEADLLEQVLALPDKYRIVIHLYYYEDYSISEISQVLRRSENTIKTQLRRGRAMLKDTIEEEG